MINNTELLSLLWVMKKARTDLASRSEYEDPELFKNFFEFERQQDMLNLAFEREFNLWVDKHFKIIDSHEEFKVSEPVSNKFNKLMVSLVEDRVLKTETSTDIASKEFCISLLSEKKGLLDSLIQINDKSNKYYKRLLYSYQKDKALFEREFNKLMEQ